MKSEGLVSSAVKCIGTQYKQINLVDKLGTCPLPQNTTQVTEEQISVVVNTVNLMCRRQVFQPTCEGLSKLSLIFENRYGDLVQKPQYRKLVRRGAM